MVVNQPPLLFSDPTAVPQRRDSCAMIITGMRLIPNDPQPINTPPIKPHR
jgi:hypothetical protein